MSIYWRAALFALCLFLIPAGLFAQAEDICSRLPVVSSVGQVGNGSNAEVVVQQMKDRAEMQAVGQTGTPAFYINGRMISGAQPFEVFKKIIDEELARK